MMATLHYIDICDVFKGQCTTEVLQILKGNNIERVVMPANSTDRLQRLDLSVNKPTNDFLWRNSRNGVPVYICANPTL